MRIDVSREDLIETLRDKGVILIENVLSAEELEAQLKALQQLEYIDAPTHFGPREVAQELALATLPRDGELDLSVDALEAKLIELFGEEVFYHSLCFTERLAQRYGHGTLGIEPHRDRPQYRGVIALLNLAGKACFQVYNGMEKPELLRLQLVPNTLLLMRATGFLGGKVIGDSCPVHRVSGIIGGVDGFRYVLGLRGT